LVRRAQVIKPPPLVRHWRQLVNWVDKPDG
jgi:hypothetical protein